MSSRATPLVLWSVTLAALALVGLPERLSDSPPPGVLRGVVVDSAGYALPDARVFLFAGDGERPRAETRSDATGAFDFRFVPPRPRVFVRAPEGSGRLDAFGPAPAEARGTLAFVLHRARPLGVRVRRAPGLTQAGLEVRVHATRGDAAALALAHTDAAGTCELRAPARAHVVVEEPASGLFRWAFDVEVPEGGRVLELELESAATLTGQLEVAGRPGAGLVVDLHTDGPDARWCGRAHSDAEGAFRLPRPPGPCTLSVHDPAGRVLSERVPLAASDTRVPHLVLRTGAPQIVRTARAGRPLATRVHLLEHARGVLGPALATDGAGRLELAVPPHFTLIATPLDGEALPIQEWDLSWSPRELLLDTTREP